MKSKIAIGCLVQWYEVEMVEDYLISLRNAVRNINPRRNVQIDICLNLNEGLEKLDTSKKEMYEIESKFVSMVKEILSGCHYVYWKTEIDIYTIADYRRDFNRTSCERADILVWGESDSLIPEQTFQVLDYLHNEVKDDTPKYISTFGINKMWDDSWKPLEHTEFTDKPFIEADTENWWSIPYTMNQEEMDEINNRVHELDVRQIQPHKFNGCGLVISSEVIKAGVNIPKSCFFINEDTAFMLMMNKVLSNVPQYHFKNLLIVHNRKHPQKRNYILGEDNDIYIDKNRTNHDWYNIANEFCKINNANLFENKKSYTWEDVWERIK